jgi:hypothetical protein
VIECVLFWSSYSDQFILASVYLSNFFMSFIPFTYNATHFRPVDAFTCSFIQLKVKNPSNTPITNVTITYTVPSRPVSLSPNPAINYTRDGGLFLYPPGTPNQVTNRYALNKRSSSGTPPVVISNDFRTATWRGVDIARKYR